MPAILSPLLLLLASAAPAAAPAPGAGPVLFTSVARVDVGPDGVVLAVAPDPTLPASVNQALAGNIRKIRFGPPMKDGQPVAGVTYVSQDACAAPDHGVYRFAVRLRGNGPAQANFPAPKFPPQAAFGAVSATMQVTYLVGTDGRATLESAELTKGSKRWERTLRGAVSEWVPELRFHTEQLDGQPVATRISYAMRFEGGEQRSFGSMAAARKYYAGQADLQAQARVAADPTCEAAMGARDGDSRQVALDSPFHPLSAN